jgi:hypothetical protein
MTIICSVGRKEASCVEGLHLFTWQAVGSDVTKGFLVAHFTTILI